MFYSCLLAQIWVPVRRAQISEMLRCNMLTGKLVKMGELASTLPVKTGSFVN
jgi:hypothetical protein